MTIASHRLAVRLVAACLTLLCTPVVWSQTRPPTTTPPKPPAKVAPAKPAPAAPKPAPPAPKVAAPVPKTAPPAPAPAPAPQGPSRAEQEAFLMNAKVVESKRVSTGVTGTIRVTLDDGVRQHDASVQRLDETKREFKNPNGTREFGFRDTWKFNLAAYHLALMLGLDAVPATVERDYQGEPASFTWWVDDVMMDEGARQKTNASDPVAGRWDHQISTMRVFDQLIANTDRNKGNLLIDKEWRVWYIDHSRAFRRSNDLLLPNVLVRCERRLFEALSTLDEASLEARIGRWTTRPERDALLARRDKIVAKLGANRSALYTRAR